MAHLHHRELCPGSHHADAVAGLYLAVHQTDIDDDATVAVIVTVEDQRPQRFTAGIQRAGNIGDDPLQHFLHIEAGLGRDPGSIQRRNSDDIFDLMGNPLRIGSGKVDLVDDRHNLQVVFQCQIGIGKGLGFDALGGIHHQHRSFTGCQRPGYLIVEVHMTGSINEIEGVILAVLGMIAQIHRPGLDGNAPLPLNIHIVQQLIFHIPAGNRFGVLQNPVRQSGFAVVNVCDYRKIANIIASCCHKLFSPA